MLTLREPTNPIANVRMFTSGSPAAFEGCRLNTVILVHHSDMLPFGPTFVIHLSSKTYATQ